MSADRKAICLIGSPRGLRSNSASLVNYLSARLTEHGVISETRVVAPVLKPGAGREALLSACTSADVIVIATPLYVDSIPAPLIRWMELYGLMRNAAKETRNRQHLAAIMNCGFPEASQNQTALGICRMFAAETGMEWIGGLALGAGGVVSGKKLEDAGRMVRPVIQALNMASEAIAAGTQIPVEAMNLMERPLIPSWLYTIAGNLGFRIVGLKNGVIRLAARPYAG